MSYDPFAGFDDVDEEEIFRNARLADVVHVLKTIMPDAEQRFVNGDDRIVAAVYRLAGLGRRAAAQQVAS